MNEKEMNLAILAELKRIAKEVFAKVTIDKEGTYTAAEIGTFKMRVPTAKLWYAIWKFEQLAHVKQEDKMRFTYGNQKSEYISAKAMYLNKEGKAAKRKKNLVKLSERVAIEIDKKTKSYNMYYFVCGLWYLIALNFDEYRYKAIKERIEKDNNYLFGLLQKWDFNNENRLNPIYKALFDAMKSERANNTPEQRKCENEPENSVIRDAAKTDAEANGKNKTEALEYTEKKMRERYPESIAIIRYGNKYYFVGESAKMTRQTEDALNYICDDGDVMYCDAEQLDNVLPKLIRAGRRVIICGHIADAPKDYESEPTDQGCDTMRSICNRAGGMEGSMDNLPKKRLASAIGYNLLPVSLRQKVFPTEPFYVRREISRFKPRYFVGCTNYHFEKENALERKRNGNTNVYRVLIRGET